MKSTAVSYVFVRLWGDLVAFPSVLQSPYRRYSKPSLEVMCTPERQIAQKRRVREDGAESVGVMHPTNAICCMFSKRHLERRTKHNPFNGIFWHVQPVRSPFAGELSIHTTAMHIDFRLEHVSIKTGIALVCASQPGLTQRICNAKFLKRCRVPSCAFETSVHARGIFAPRHDRGKADSSTTRTRARTHEAEERTYLELRQRCKDMIRGITLPFRRSSNAPVLLVRGGNTQKAEGKRADVVLRQRRIRRHLGKR